MDSLCVLRFTIYEVNHNLEQVLLVILEACQNAQRYGANRSQDTG